MATSSSLQANTVSFDPPRLRRLQLAYITATNLGQSEFEFEGNIYLTRYAKYLIEYLELQFKLYPNW